MILCSRLSRSHLSSDRRNPFACGPIHFWDLHIFGGLFEKKMLDDAMKIRSKIIYLKWKLLDV